MKHLILLSFTTVAFLFSCDKEEVTTIDDLRAEATVWKLDSYSGHTGASGYTIDLDSERTLQFWRGRLYTNGSICDLNGPVGPEEEADYDAETERFTIEGCTFASGIGPKHFSYGVDLDRGILGVRNLACVEGCSFNYRRSED